MRAMKSSRYAQVFLAVSITFSPVVISQSAIADSNNQTTPAPDAFKAAMDQYRADRDIYMNAMRQRSQQIRSINILFKNSCDTALNDFKSAMSQARTPDQKNAAIASRKNAISAAIIARDAAINALGTEPTPPAEPIKPAQAPGKNKSR